MTNSEAKKRAKKAVSDAIKKQPSLFPAEGTPDEAFKKRFTPSAKILKGPFDLETKQLVEVMLNDRAKSLMETTREREQKQDAIDRLRKIIENEEKFLDDLSSDEKEDRRDLRATIFLYEKLLNLGVIDDSINEKVQEYKLL